MEHDYVAAEAAGSIRKGEPVVIGDDGLVRPADPGRFDRELAQIRAERNRPSDPDALQQAQESMVRNDVFHQPMFAIFPLPPPRSVYSDLTRMPCAEEEKC